MNARYQKIKTIDVSKDGMVVLVEDQLLGQRCIQKSVYRSANSTRIHQWRTEVHVLSELNGERFPKLMDVYEEDTSLSLIESLIEGESLNDWLLKHSFLKRRMRRRLFLELVFCISQLHQKGFLYVDIKPDNCLIKDNHLYLIDFNSCIEMGSVHVVSASKENYHSAMREKRAKGIDTDIYGLIGLLKRLYPHHVVMRLFGLIAKRRHWKDIKHFRNWFIWIHRGQRALSALLIVYLSVFLLTRSFLEERNPMTEYQHQPTATNFWEAYHFYSQNKETYQVLYQWVGKDWIDPSSWKDKEIASYLLEQAIQCNDPELIRAVMKHIPKKTLQAIPMLEFQAIVKSHRSLTQKDVTAFLNVFSQQDDCISMCKFIQYLLQSEFVLNDQQCIQLMKWMKSMTSKITHPQVMTALEYSLFLASQNQRHFYIPKPMAQRFKEKEDFKEMYSLWEESQ